MHQELFISQNMFIQTFLQYTATCYYYRFIKLTMVASVLGIERVCSTEKVSFNLLLMKLQSHSQVGKPHSNRCPVYCGKV